MLCAVGKARLGRRPSRHGGLGHRAPSRGRGLRNPHRQPQGPECAALPQISALLAQARIELEREFELARTVQELYTALDQLYRSGRSEQEKLSERHTVFAQHTAALHAKYPNLKILKKLNNAEIMQLRLYLTDFPRFRELYEQSGKWDVFLKAAEKIAQDGKR